MNIDCLGAGVSMCPQFGGEYALTSNLGHCGEYWVFLLLHELHPQYTLHSQYTLWSIITATY